MDFNCTPVSAAFRSTLETRGGDTARVTACTHFKVDSVQAQNSAVLHTLYVREHMFYVRMMYHHHKWMGINSWLEERQCYISLVQTGRGSGLAGQLCSDLLPILNNLLSCLDEDIFNVISTEGGTR